MVKEKTKTIPNVDAMFRSHLVNCPIARTSPQDHGMLKLSL